MNNDRRGDFREVELYLPRHALEVIIDALVHRNSVRNRYFTTAEDADYRDALIEVLREVKDDE